MNDKAIERLKIRNSFNCERNLDITWECKKCHYYYESQMAAYDRPNCLMMQIRDWALYKEEKMNNWISIKTELPQEGQKVLISSKSFGVVAAIYDYIINDESGLKELKFFIHYSIASADMASVNDVTAWQPLPEPYKEEEDA